MFAWEPSLGREVALGGGTGGAGGGVRWVGETLVGPHLAKPLYHTPGLHSAEASIPAPTRLHRAEPPPPMPARPHWAEHPYHIPGFVEQSFHINANQASSEKTYSPTPTRPHLAKPLQASCSRAPHRRQPIFIGPSFYTDAKPGLTG